MTGVELVTVGVAAIIAGAVGALAGGGTLITFPVLLAVGVPPVAANVTNTVALCSGYLGGALAEPTNGFVQHHPISVGHGWEKARVNVRVSWGPDLNQAVAGKVGPYSREKDMRVKLARDKGRNLRIAVFGSEVGRGL